MGVRCLHIYRAHRCPVLQGVWRRFRGRWASDRILCLGPAPHKEHCSFKYLSLTVGKRNKDAKLFTEPARPVQHFVGLFCHINPPIILESPSLFGRCANPQGTQIGNFPVLLRVSQDSLGNGHLCSPSCRRSRTLSHSSSLLPLTVCIKFVSNK